MRVYFLGTGAAEGLPALFCHCSICVQAKRRGGPDLRTRSTILIDDTIKIDLPPDTLSHVHRYPDICLARLEHLLFTHGHDDHFAARELQYLSPNFAPDRQLPLKIYGTKELLTNIEQEASRFYEEAPLRLQPVTPFKPQRVGHLQVTPIIAHHKTDEICLNYLLTDLEMGRTLLYASDTGWWDAPTWDFLESSRTRVDTVILECGKGGSDNPYDGHLNIEECARVKQTLADMGVTANRGNVPFYLTHICHTGLLLHEEMNEIVAPHGMTAAYDGLQITV